MTMKKICILGAGPAATTTGLLLKRNGFNVTVIGKARTRDALEGLSLRAIDGLRLAGATCLQGVNDSYARTSCWGGAPIEANGEYVVNRVEFDGGLIFSLQTAGAKFVNGQVVNVRHTGSEWAISYRPSHVSTVTAFDYFDFLIEARGTAASLSTGSELTTCPSVALGCSFVGAELAEKPRTISEPFSDGWAWATLGRDGVGHLQIVVHPDEIQGMQSNLAGFFQGIYKRLKYIPLFIGRRPAFSEYVDARGIRPSLRSHRVSINHLRVGDAAYSVDPLSGHGIFEAVSGAYAALPVINTIINRPESAELAVRYYRDRSRSLFISRLLSAEHFYRSETRWADRPFWSERSVMGQAALGDAARATTGSGVEFLRIPVVEDGYVTERNVVSSPDFPRGVRFIDGVDLNALREKISESTSSPDLQEISRLLNAEPTSVLNAWSWLAAKGAVAGPVAVSPTR